MRVPAFLLAAVATQLYLGDSAWTQLQNTASLEPAARYRSGTHPDPLLLRRASALVFLPYSLKTIQSGSCLCCCFEEKHILGCAFNEIRVKYTQFSLYFLFRLFAIVVDSSCSRCLVCSHGAAALPDSEHPGEFKLFVSHGYHNAASPTWLDDTWVFSSAARAWQQVGAASLSAPAWPQARYGAPLGKL